MEPVLNRFGFHVNGYQLPASGRTLRVQFVVRGELNWSRRRSLLVALMAERLSRAVAEVVALGIEDVQAGMLEEGDATFAVLLMPRALGYETATVRLREMEPALARHNFDIDDWRDEGLDLQIRLALREELAWRREHPSPRTLIQEGLPLVVDELSSLGANVGKAVFSDRDGRPVGILELRRSRSSRLGLANLTGLDPELERSGLHVTEVEHVRVGRRKHLRIRLHLHDELDWTRRIPLTAEIVARRLAEVAAALAASDAEVEVIRSHVELGEEGPQGRLFLAMPRHLDQRLGMAWLLPPQFGNRAAELELFFDRDGWALGWNSQLIKPLPASLGAPAATIVDEALEFVLQEPPVPSAPLLLPDWVTIAGAAAVTSLIMPFAQAIAGKAADDAYALLRHLFHREAASRLEEREDRPRAAPWPGSALRSPSHVVIRDPVTETVLVMPDPPPHEAIRQLIGLDPEPIHGQVLVWDRRAKLWQPIDDQPSPSR